MLDYSGERAYTAIAQEVPSSGIELNNPIRSVPDDFRHIPEAGTLTWQDDFFDDDDVVARPGLGIAPGRGPVGMAMPGGRQEVPGRVVLALWCWFRHQSEPSLVRWAR